MKTTSLLLLSVLLTSCAWLQSPEGKKTIVALSDIGLRAAVEHGKLSPGDVVQVQQGVAVVTDGTTTMTKIVKLSEIGLSAAVSKGVLKQGDAVLIQEATAVITQAVPPEAKP